MFQHKDRAATHTYGGPLSSALRSVVIPRLLSIETSAVVIATAADVERRRGALMLRLWHHVGDEPVRTMLFEDFVLAGRPLGLIGAIVCTAQQGRWHGRLPRGMGGGPPMQEIEIDRLERALTRSMVEVLGPLASPMVRRAWRDALRVLLERPTPVPA